MIQFLGYKITKVEMIKTGYTIILVLSFALLVICSAYAQNEMNSGWIAKMLVEDQDTLIVIDSDR